MGDRGDCPLVHVSRSVSRFSMAVPLSDEMLYNLIGLCNFFRDLEIYHLSLFLLLRGSTVVK